MLGRKHFYAMTASRKRPDGVRAGVSLSLLYKCPGQKIEWQDLTGIIRLTISDLIRSDENRTQNRRPRFLTLNPIALFFYFFTL